MTCASIAAVGQRRDRAFDPHEIRHGQGRRPPNQYPSRHSTATSLEHRRAPPCPALTSGARYALTGNGLLAARQSVLQETA